MPNVLISKLGKNLIIQEVKQIQLVRSADYFPTSSCDRLKQNLENWFDIKNNCTNLTFNFNYGSSSVFSSYFQQIFYVFIRYNLQIYNNLKYNFDWCIISVVFQSSKIKHRDQN